MRNSKEISGVLRPRKQRYPEVIPGIQLQLPNKLIKCQGLFNELSNPSESDDAAVIVRESLIEALNTWHHTRTTPLPIRLNSADFLAISWSQICGSPLPVSGPGQHSVPSCGPCANTEFTW